MSTEQLTGLQLAIALLAQIGNDDSDRTIAAVHDLAEEHAQRLTLQHHACDQAQRIADLEVKCVTLKDLHDAATDERDALRAKYDELLVALHGIGAALEIPEGNRSPYSVTCGVLERVNRLAEIETQEPVDVQVSVNNTRGTWHRPAPTHDEPTPLARAQYLCANWPNKYSMRLLYARPIPAQAVPDADAARYRWLRTRPIEAPTNGPDLALWSDSCGDALRGDDADAAIDAAMAAAPEHKA